MILVCDLDGTLIASPPVPEVDGVPDFAAWERLIATQSPDPVPGALKGLRSRLRGARALWLLTARSERLRAATCQWVRTHMAGLRVDVLSMRQFDDLRSGAASKAARLQSLRQMLARGRAAHVIDDDPEMRGHLRSGDRFDLAPSCWGGSEEAA